MTWLKKFALIVLIGISSITFSGCSLTDFVKPKPSVEANAQVGKENHQKNEDNQFKIESGTTEQKANAISNDTSYKADVVNQITSNLNWWQMVLIVVLAGVALPSWKELGAGFKYSVIEIYKGVRFMMIDLFSLILVPCKGIRDFILELLGKKTDAKS